MLNNNIFCYLLTVMKSCKSYYYYMVMAPVFERQNIYLVTKQQLDSALGHTAAVR